MKQRKKAQLHFPITMLCRGSVETKRRAEGKAIY